MRYLLTISSILLSWVAPGIVEHIQLYVFLGVVGTVGMAHGSLDHLVHQASEKNSRGMLRFYAGYLLATASVAAVWFWEPVLGLSLFIASSAYHFGQAEIPDDQKDAPPLIWVRRFSWGMALLALLLIVHSAAIFRSLQAWEMVTTPRVLQILGWLTLLLAAGAYCLTSRGKKSREAFHSALYMPVVSWMGYAILLCVTPPLWGFTLYFGIWHAWPALEQVARTLKLNQAKDWLKALLPNYLPSLLATLAWIALASEWVPEYTVAGLLVLLSALTVPHTFVFERLYRKA
jgi:Brp/Blh family beta-carotene 15,15'-monooxygenase